ncbi:MAG TPA: CsbD family protein [Xanthobacteraceae bacterium]|nr:CsbD family protein [Xanthobacteraceae bacterium]
MNWDRIEGNWNQFKGKVQQQWGNLTEDDLDVVEGNRKELSGKIQERYGVAKDEAEKQIDDWLSRSH